MRAFSMADSVLPSGEPSVRGRDFNAEYTDQLGRSALHLAVVNDHKEVSSQSNLPHRYGNSHAIQDHTVLPATRQR